MGSPCSFEVDGMMRRDGNLRVKEAAELLGVAPHAVRSGGSARKIPD
jgi:hypothetical protein